MKLFRYDIFRYYGKYRLSILNMLSIPNSLKYLICFRKCQSTHNYFFKLYYRIKLHYYSNKFLIQIPYSTKIGKGLYIGHNGTIIINPNTIIGNNVNLATGVTIGQENRGKRKGAPIIGNNVWIGSNSVVVGNIKIGNDVLIAPLSFVNFNIPDHSIVIGNPGKIISCKCATDCYLNRLV